jgi:hypothetical protein
LACLIAISVSMAFCLPGVAPWGSAPRCCRFPPVAGQRAESIEGIGISRVFAAGRCRHFLGNGYRNTIAKVGVEGWFGTTPVQSNWPSDWSFPAFPMKITFRMSHDRGRRPCPPPPFSRLPRKISEGAQPFQVCFAKSRSAELLASSDRRHPVVSLEAEGASGRSTGQIRAYLPCAPLQKSSAPTARQQ